MLIIGCDYHPAFQQIAFVDTETASCKSGDWSTLRQRRSSTVIWRPREAECAWRWKPVDMRWFERLLAELTSSCGSGTPPRSPGSASKPKTDRQDAQHILHLLLKDDFPQIWVPSWENRDLRQLLWHRHRMVQARTRIMNQLQAVAINEGLRSKKRLWRGSGREQLQGFRLAPGASRRREDLLKLLNFRGAEPDECRADASDRAGSGEMSGSAAVENPPWSRATDRTGVRADYRASRSVSVWQADREVSGTGAAGRFEREPATTRTYHEARELFVALPAGGSGASDGAQPPGMAQPVWPPVSFSVNS